MINKRILTKARKVTQYLNGPGMPGGQENLMHIKNNPNDLVHVYIEEMKIIGVFDTGEEMILGYLKESYEPYVQKYDTEVVNYQVTGGHDLGGENEDGFINLAYFGFNLEIKLHERVEISAK